MDAQTVIAGAPLLVLSTFLLVLAAIDLARRPSAAVSGGHKPPWVLALLVPAIGPVVYLWFGRRAYTIGGE